MELAQMQYKRYSSSMQKEYSYIELVYMDDEYRREINEAFSDYGFRLIEAEQMLSQIHRDKKQSAGNPNHPIATIRNYQSWADAELDARLNMAGIKLAWRNLDKN